MFEYSLNFQLLRSIRLAMYTPALMFAVGLY